MHITELYPAVVFNLLKYPIFKTGSASYYAHTQNYALIRYALTWHRLYLFRKWFATEHAVATNFESLILQADS